MPETLPNLGEPGNAALSPAKAAEIGRKIVNEMYRANYIVSDPELETFINSIGWQLASHGTARPPEFRFLVLADNGINAVTLPGSIIGVNVGTIVAAANVSELAAVMAHEEAHVTQNHIARTADRSPIASIATWAAVIGAMIAAAASGSGGDAIEGGLILGQSINTQREINYTRGNELEADRVGIETLARAGYQPLAMADFFGRLQQQTRLYGQIPQILLDHPVNSTRIAEATERAERYPASKLPSSISFELMRARGRVLEANAAADALKYFDGELRSGKATAGNHYGYAMTLHLTGQDRQALQALQPLLKEWPDDRDVLLLESRIHAGAGDIRSALAVDQRVLSTNPGYAPAILQTADDLITAGKPLDARKVLLSHQQSYGTSPRTWQLLARAALASGNPAEAAFQMSNYYVARENPLAALDQLNAGLRLGDISADARARLRARRQELIASIPRHALREHQRQERDRG
ncbi:MAG TPA: M48 family metalloprotease [Nevskiaceae bacterium]